MAETERKDETATADAAALAGGRGERLMAVLADLLGNRLYRAVGLLFLFAIVFNYFEAIIRVVLIAFVGVIVAIAFNTVVIRLPMRRAFGTAVMALLTLSAIGAGAWFGITVLAREIRSLVEDMPGIMASLEEWEGWLEELTGLDMELIGPRIRQGASQIVGDVEGGAVLAGAFGLVELVALAVLVLVGSFFLVAKPNDQLLDSIIRVVPRESRPAVRETFDRLGERLSGWLWGTLLSMLIIAVLSSVAFWLLGAPYPILLGTIVGLLDIIPLIGPWIGGIIAVIVTLFYDPGTALWVAVAVLAIQEVEGNLVRPMVMSESAKLHPFVTLLALLLFGSMWGLLGAVLALPLVLAIGTIVEVLWVEETLGTHTDEIEPLVEK